VSDLIAVSYFANRTDNAPTRAVYSWSDLKQQLSAPRLSQCSIHNCIGADCPHKNGPAWSPAIYPAGAPRAKANVESVSVLVLDLDHLTGDQLVRAAQSLAPFRYIAHASHSDSNRPPRDIGTPEKPKLIDGRCIRVIIALTRPVTRDEWPRFWSSACVAFGIPVDRQTSDCSRIYYLPSRPQAADYYFAHQDGALLDVDGVLAAAPPVIPYVDVVDELVPSAGCLATSEQLGVAAMELAANWPKSGRHGAQLALSGALAREGWDPDTIADFCAMVARLEPGRPPGYDGYENGKRHAAARSSVAKFDSGEQIAGWGSLAKLLGDSGQNVVESIGRKLGLNANGDAWADTMMRAAPTLPQNLSDALGFVASSQLPPDQIAPLIEEMLLEDTPPVRSFPTGINALDAALGGGVSTQQVTVIAAPPGASKTGFVMSLGLHIEATSNVPVLYASTELLNNEISIRFGANVCDVSWRDALRGRVDKQKLYQAVRGKRIRGIGRDKWPRTEGTIAPLTLLAERVAAMKEQYGVAPLVIVDYLQQLARGSEEGLKGRVGQLMMGLLVIAQHFDCPVIAVSNVSRAYYGQAKQQTLRAAKDPVIYLGAAKESGDIDYDAATIIYVDLEKSVSNALGVAVALALAKVRHGETCFVGARAKLDSGRWYEDASAADEVLGSDGSAQRVMQGFAKRVASEADATADDAKVIAAARLRPQPKNMLRDTCGIPPKRVDEALIRCLGDGRLVLHKDEGLDALGRARRNVVLVMTPDMVPSAPAPFIQRPVVPADPALAAFLGQR
jgi:hypothetical protein